MQRDLVISARAGDHEAFTALIGGAIDRLYAVARLIVRDDDRARDAVQDALLRAWTGLPGLRDPDRFDAWLQRLLVHACYRAARQERSRRIIEIHVDVDGASRDAQGGLALRDQLERGFLRLSPDQRAVLVLHYYLDLTDAAAGPCSAGWIRRALMLPPLSQGIVPFGLFVRKRRRLGLVRGDRLVDQVLVWVAQLPGVSLEDLGFV